MQVKLHNLLKKGEILYTGGGFDAIIISNITGWGAVFGGILPTPMPFQAISGKVRGETPGLSRQNGLTEYEEELR